MYKNTKFRADSLNLIERVNSIITEYSSKGYELTLRQVYYQLVATGVIENTERSYKNLGTLISNARLAGLVDWESIVDRTRNLRGFNYDLTPESTLNNMAMNYKTDPWIGQEHYVEVWVEKDALVDIVGKIAGQLDIDYFSCRGYVSQSAMYRAARRLHRQVSMGKNVTILHLGDHDPSGIDMSRDIETRLNTFEVFPKVERIALNMNQIELYNPPPNPTKITDSRAKEYITNFGYECWELDALKPEVINDLIFQKVTPLINYSLMKSLKSKMQEERDLIETIAYNWDQIKNDYGMSD
ncbi:hypothetical protein ARW38_13665 [Listeria monocytogenes]|nr:hypothetical protein [Listeria monocytogenes]ECC0876454.1 hypothetical protein [Listeria monocytogenes]ECK6821645.1 hypothetical protein [Listeria monocytogenes]